MTRFEECLRCTVLLILLVASAETRYLGLSKPGSPSKYIEKSKKLEFKIRQLTKIFTRPNTPEELRMLPWQVSLFLRFFEPENDSSEALFHDQPERPASAFLTAGYKFLVTCCERLQGWISRHKKSFQLAGKASAIAFVGFLLLRRLGNWYKGMAEYELLLDNTDYEYQAYGGCFNGIGGSLMASLNHTAVAEYKYTQLVRNLVGALDVPCFPQTMTNFAIETGKDVAVLLGDFDVRLRDWKRRNKHLCRMSFGFNCYAPPFSLTSSSNASVVEKAERGGENGVDFTSVNKVTLMNQEAGTGENIINAAEQGIKPTHELNASYSHTNTNYSTSTTTMDSHTLNELLVLRGIQHGVTVLQVRQADACLRIARLQILSAANTVEDLLTQWRGRVASRSQTLRLPLPRILMSRIPGLKRGLRAKPLLGIRKALNLFKFNSDGSTGDSALSYWSMAYWSRRKPNSSGAVGSVASNDSTVATVITTADNSGATVGLNTTAASKTEGIVLGAKNATKSLSGGARDELDGDDDEDDEEDDATNVDDVLRDLNSREKVLLLEGMQQGLYQMAGKIQSHLYALEGIRTRLIDESNNLNTPNPTSYSKTAGSARQGSSSSSSSGGVFSTSTSESEATSGASDAIGTTPNAFSSPQKAAGGASCSTSCSSGSSTGFGSYEVPTPASGLLSDSAERVWVEVDDWISQAGELCATSMALVMMQDSERREATLAARAMEGVYSKKRGKKRREKEKEREREQQSKSTKDNTPKKDDKNPLQVASEAAVNQAAKVGAAVEDLREAAASQAAKVGAAVQDFGQSVVRVIDDRRKGILRKFHSHAAEREDANGLAGLTTGDSDNVYNEDADSAFSAAGCSPDQFANVCTMSLDDDEVAIQGSTNLGSFVLHAGLGDVLETCFVKGDVFAHAVEEVGDDMEWSSCWSAVGVEGGEFGEKSTEDPSQKGDAAPTPHADLLEGATGLEVADESQSIRRGEGSSAAASPKSSSYYSSYYSSVYSRATSRVLMKAFGTAYNFLLHGSEHVHSPQYSSYKRRKGTVVKTNATTTTGESIASLATASGSGSADATDAKGDQKKRWNMFSWGQGSTIDSSSADTTTEYQNVSSSPQIIESEQDAKLPFLWTRQLKYTHKRAGGLFSGPTTTRHTLVQVLNTHKVSLMDPTMSARDGCSGRATIVGFMNLSHVQFCQGCSYTTRWVFTDVLQSQDRPHGHTRSKNHLNPATTQVSVYLDTKVPPSIYQRFIVSGIKAELRTLVEAFRRSAVSKLADPSSGSSWAELHTLKSHGDLLLLRAVGKDDASHGDDGENVATEYSESGDDDDVGGGALYTSADSLAVAERLSTLDDVVDSFTHSEEGIVRRSSTRDDDQEDSNDGDNDLRDPLDWEMPWLSHDHPAASTVIGTSSVTSSGTNTNSAALLRPLNSLSTFDAMDLKLQRLRSHWRLSATVLKSLAKAPHIFQDHLAAIGLSRKRRKGIFALLRLKTLLKLTCWSGLTYAAVEAAKRSGDIAAAAELAKKNAADFIQRRLTTPTVSIVNDVILNKRISITDKDALIDARRSLSVMLNDFLVQHRPKMSEAERRRAVQKLDMRPVSEEYELELRRPLRNLIAGQIAKLVFIQLQFVKKELLEAMQAIDELFNANQVNLQLLAVTPAVLSLLLAQAVSRSIFNAVKSSSRGRLLESSSVVYRDLRSAIRLLEKLLSMSPNNPSGYLSQTELGNMMAILHRIHNILVLNAAHFDNLSLHQMQEDLRDLSEGRLNIGQRLALVERIVRSYPFLQPQRKLWPIA